MKTIDTPPSVIDPVISEIRRHKQTIAEKFDFDVVALGRSLQQRQGRDRRFVTLKGGQAAADRRREHVVCEAESPSSGV